jgi:putative hemolysin
MTFSTKVAAVTAALALSAPALALAAPPPGVPGADHRPATTPAANAGTAHKPASPGSQASSKAKRFGKLCQEQGASKKHVRGEKGTEFSRCVTAMAHLAKGTKKSPAAACKAAGLTKKHAEGEKGTPFSRCVAAGAKLLREQRQG